MLQPREMTVADVRETSTEYLIKAIKDVEANKAKLVRQDEADAVNPLYDEALRSDFREMNKQFFRLWTTAEDRLRAELKSRLH